MTTRLNAICPYFAMFPIDYPMGIIESCDSTSVLDPFCGRGTTNIAARLNGIHTVGIDSSKVAFSISSAKMVETTPEAIKKACDDILKKEKPAEVPQGKFWQMMYDPNVLADICRIRDDLLEDCSTPEKIALRAIVMGALHGPLRKDKSSSYLSNQFPRTYASKPDYSVKYWENKNLKTPPKVQIKDIVGIRADRYYSEKLPEPKGFIINADSTEQSTFDVISERLTDETKFDTVITSPPYIGMSTYIQDQWIRNWFVGGPEKIDYSKKKQIRAAEEGFIKQLNRTWKGCESVCKDDARMAIRFGKIGSRLSEPKETIRKTFDGTSWEDITITNAGTPVKGHRQCESFSLDILDNYNEIDVMVKLKRS